MYKMQHNARKIYSEKNILGYSNMNNINANASHTFYYVNATKASYIQPSYTHSYFHSLKIV